MDTVEGIPGSQMKSEFWGREQSPDLTGEVFSDCLAQPGCRCLDWAGKNCLQIEDQHPLIEAQPRGWLHPDLINKLARSQQQGLSADPAERQRPIQLLGQPVLDLLGPQTAPLLINRSFQPHADAAIARPSLKIEGQ